MTEKQFFIRNGKHMILEYEFYNGKNRLSPLEVIELLNEQHETIQQLQRELDKTIEMLNKEINTSEKAFDGLLKENEKLKEELRNLRRLANELYMEENE